MIRFALLGCGRIGKMHAANLSTHPDACLARVYDIHEPSAREVGDRLGVEVAASPEEIFESAEVDAVLVATATETHADSIERAVAAGKPVLCEKPIDLSLARVEECARRIAGRESPSSSASTGASIPAIVARAIPCGRGRSGSFTR